MKKSLFYIIASVLFVCNSNIYAQKPEEYVPPGGARLMVQVMGTDTIFLAYLHDIWVFPKQRFKK
jgi:hypothetical protein